jgi:alpha-ketoglutarate-dependent sulfate ester dioxygenase
MTAVFSDRIAVVPLSGTIGARIEGVDAGSALDSDVVEAVREAVRDYRVVFLPEQRITAAEVVAFAAGFGEVLEAHPLVPGLADQPEILEVGAASAYPARRQPPRWRGWHADGTFLEETHTHTLLHSQLVAARGGDTEWVDLVASYEGLSATLRAFVDGLVAVHDPNLQFGAYGQTDGDRREKLGRLPVVRHPLIRVDPLTGVRSLLLNPLCLSHIEGLSPDENDALLELLYDQVLRDEHVVRWNWTVGDLAIWENRTTLHRVVEDFGDQPRRNHRVVVGRERLVGPNGFTSSAA